MPDIYSHLKTLTLDTHGYGLEFKYQQWETDFLRFYRSQINANITKRSVSLTCTIEKDKRKYSFELSNPTISQIDQAIEEGKKIVQHLPPDPDFHSFEDDKNVYEYTEYSNSINDIQLQDKIEILKPIAEFTASHGFSIYGSFITLRIDRHILNSTGINKHYYQSPVMLELKAVNDKTMATVIDSYGGNDLSKFNIETFIDRLSQKIMYSTFNIIDCEPGYYNVILSPHAVYQFLEYLIGEANARNLDNGTSFFESKVGKKIFPHTVTISSQPQHPMLIAYPYNQDGHLASNLSIIEKGVFKNFIVDHYYAHKLKLKKNGSVGEYALVMEPGNSSLDQMFASVKNGLYISNIHYMNFINQKETSVTGLTRDGTFLISDGKIVNLVKNLRYTVRLASILENLTAIENRCYAIPQSQNYEEFQLYSGLVPHILTENFHISSSTGTI